MQYNNNFREPPGHNYIFRKTCLDGSAQKKLRCGFNASWFSIGAMFMEIVKVRMMAGGVILAKPYNTPFSPHVLCKQDG